MTVAIIPARGGSKRIPRKNILAFAGKPMIAWPIAAARASGCFEHIVVSTDDDEIASVARSCGAETPFMRPVDLADDHTGTMAVVRHAIDSLHRTGIRPEHVCLIHATAPFLRPGDLRTGYRVLCAGDCEYVFPVATFPSPIQRALRIGEDGRVGMFHPEQLHSRSQDLEPAYHDAAQFWWGLTTAWLAMTPVYSPASRPLHIPRYRVQDIDTPEDWARAEQLFRAFGDVSE